MATLILVYIIAVHVLAIPAIAFPLLYFRSQWNHTAAGRALMLSTGGFAFFLAATITRYWINHSDSDTIAGIVFSIGLVAVLIGVWSYLLSVLLRTQARSRRERDGRH